MRSQVFGGGAPQMPALGLEAKPRFRQLQLNCTWLTSQYCVHVTASGLAASRCKHCAPDTHCSDVQGEPTGSDPKDPQNVRPLESAKRHVCPLGQLEKKRLVRSQVAR